MTDALKRPLVFGDKEQIAAVRELERKTFWDSLPNCDTCKGDGTCSRCDHECTDCDTFGKTFEAMETFREAFPGWTTWSQTRG